MLIPINITEYCMIKWIKLYSTNILFVIIAEKNELLPFQTVGLLSDCKAGSHWEDLYISTNEHTELLEKSGEPRKCEDTLCLKARERTSHFIPFLP